MTKCKFWDCGWCYAPKGADTNKRGDSACMGSKDCKEYKKQKQEDNKK